jgi:hypothetical protein
MSATLIPGFQPKPPQEKLVKIGALIELNKPNKPITKIVWNHKEGITWWLTNASQHLESMIDALKIKVSDTNLDIEDIKQHIEEVEKKLSQLPQDKAFALKTYPDSAATFGV